MGPALRLKRKMITWIAIGSAGYCMSEIINFGFVNMLGDHWTLIRLRIIVEGTQFIWFGLILWVAQPRRQWPAFFTLSVHDFNQN